ncbi:MAG: DegV family EDD domain-containing protein [Gammaproteobacteria bacterium]|nr:DegV family EDD domain-containing protein [Gammaproteobacteria bacterium]MDH4313478.1 DegV family EDD domain-containing protein [Gammaproteobacteria bacterium]MDH5213054.1 DegV family EDD domain-containing protein [Gammaproteobacteria bacterium]
MSTLPAPHTQLHADMLATALRCGIHRVILEQDSLNRINVFPVADGDTGTNLSLSLGAALGVLKAPHGDQLGKMLESVADAMLDGARGNSGAIIAQFFQGMSDSAENLARFTADTFSHAVSRGSEYAHDALAKPREGTILSVIRAFADSLQEQLSNTSDIAFPDLLGKAVETMRKALVRTQNQLEELRKAGVVDAGAKGFVALIDGFANFLIHGLHVEEPAIAGQIVALQPDDMPEAGDEPAFRYCTECIVTGENIDRRKLREALSETGDSLVLAGTKRKARIHIHVNEPAAVFDIARQYGVLAQEKADDMLRQVHSSHDKRIAFAVITDSAADIDDDALEKLDIHIVPARIQFGDRGYLDKVSITSEEFFRELDRNPAHPTTSQPAPGDFRRQFQFLASHFRDVISVNLSPSVSGTWQAAVSAAQRTAGPGKIHVVDSRNASLGQGLLAVFAAECADAGLDAESALVAIAAAIPVTHTFAMVRDLRYAVRGGRVPATVSKLADLLHVTPVLRTTNDGAIKARGILPGKLNRLPKFAAFVARRVPRDRPIRLAIGHAVCLDEALELESLLRTRLPRLRSSSVTNLGSAVGVHGGPGTLVVGTQECLDPQQFKRK